ncbi:MAG: glycine betaine ABC transporter substrate-binding protein [Deltaproteobacteria bacterium]|nr:glycine betaine ABC transporter substrate-binding protein [Candidatus Anaeroferrophillus wilburensis]MBN2889622.1 glycine betaine ABC transporter substrate-binding protein [Deltaproteobacteria bacterium]
MLVAVMMCLGLFFAVQPAVAGKGKVELAYVEWDCATASTHVMKAVLEELGYDVEVIPVAAAAMWQSIAVADADAMVTAWLPTTHGHYLKRFKDKVVDLGANLHGTRIGLVVPQYVTINSIDELQANAAKFDNKIIGIDPGAGLMSKTEQVVEEYRLNKMKLMDGSGATMAAALQDAIKNNEWVVVTGWTPHWKFARWDLKYLDDPKGVYGGEEFISTMVRRGLKEDMPEVYAVLDNFSWTPKDIAEVMIMNRQDGADPEETGRQWVKEHQDKVKKWLP